MTIAAVLPRWAGALAFVCVSALASPVFAKAPPPPPVDVLGQAQACYGAGDLACVLRLLTDAPLEPAKQSEQFRLLAFAAARLDQHEVARKHFAAWVKASPQNKLERATTPPAIFADYTAALLASQTGALDWTPQVDNHALLPPAPVTPTDLPRFAPPPRQASTMSQRLGFLIGLHGSLPVSKDWGPPWAHLGLGLGLELDAAYGLSAGLLVGGWQRPDQGALRWNPYALFRGGWGTRFGDHGVRFLLGGGVALDTGDDSVVGALAPALRYDWRPPDRVAGFFAELASQTLFGSQKTTEVIGVTVGVLLHAAAN